MLSAKPKKKRVEHRNDRRAEQIRSNDSAGPIQEDASALTKYGKFAGTIKMNMKQMEKKKA